MLVKILGIVDLVIGLILIFGSSAKLPYLMLLVIAIILFVKAGIGLLRDFASWIDLIVGVIFIFLIFFPVSGVISIITGILIIQKGIISFL
jgi:hypothetical protein